MLELLNYEIIFALVLMLIIYVLVGGAEDANILANVLFVIGFAGSVCSLIDKIFWGESLDYIQFFNLFIFDLKDCYLTISEVLIIFLRIKYEKYIKFMDYLRF